MHPPAPESLLTRILRDHPEKLRKLSDKDLATLHYDWPAWARDDQLPPPGDWRYWMILAGRGFGKSRTGAEWIRAMARQTPHITIIGATANDARTIMVEGESGILACCPTSERPKYMAHKGELHWPNGSKTQVLGAEEPERFRGKQHSTIWADELCLAGDSLIATSKGEVPIEMIRAGDMVHTRQGLRRVVRAWQSSQSAEVFELVTTCGKRIVGTANHPIFTEEYGFLPLQFLHHGVTLNVWEQNEQLSGAGNDGGSGLTTTKTGKANFSIGRNILTRMGKSLTNGMSTMSMVISSITTSRIFVPCRAASTSESMSHAGLLHGISSSGLSVASNHGAKKLQSLLFASGAKRCLSQQGSAPSIVGLIARWLRLDWPTRRTKRGASILKGQPSHVSFVVNCLRRVTRELFAVRANVASSGNCKVSSVRKLNERIPVFNIEVEDVHEYFANGILTHNCSWRYPETWDQAMMGLRLGKPRALITTTPRPTPIIRRLMEDKHTHLTRGSTYDNRANLAPEFMDAIIKRFEGTRLGRQELNAEILTDNPGALWQRDLIEASRVQQAPELIRTVIGVDPAATSGEESDMTGIVVCALGRDKRGYVLADYTLRASPADWARKVAWAASEHKADRIVVEVNNGGEMCEAVLRHIAPNLPITQVRASHGKYARAEPIAALYEQGRVSHVGGFAALEDQLTDYVPGEGRRSPDRLDALVWAMHHLMPPTGAGNYASAGGRTF